MMKLFSLFLVLISFSAFADQSCLRPTYEFRIKKHFIEAKDEDDVIRVVYNEVRSVTLNNGRNNSNFIRWERGFNWKNDVY